MNVQSCIYRTYGMVFLARGGTRSLRWTVSEKDSFRAGVVVVVVFILIRKPNGQICPMKRWRMQIESSNK